MTVSKAFWKIVLKNLGNIVLYTVILLMFGTVSAQSSTTTTQFEARKPKIAVFNHDKDAGLTHNLLAYLDENAEVQQDYSEDRVKDDLFYESIAMAIDIPEGYGEDFVAGKNPEVHTRTSSGYIAELAKVMLSRYLTTAQSYVGLGLSDDEMAAKIGAALDSKVEVKTLSKVDASKFAKITSYFNFANYAALCCIITIICLIISSFNRREVRRRNLISSTKISKMNRILLRNCCVYSLAVWALYAIFGYLMAGNEELIGMHGLLYLANFFVFCVCATTIAYLISQLVSGRNAVNAIMYIVALGSSFLCGCFVPAEFLPESVLAFAHVLPSFYFVDANNMIGKMGDLNAESLRPVLINMAVVLAFSAVFMIAANIVAKKKQRE